MLGCKACIRRLIYTVFSDTFNPLRLSTAAASFQGSIHSRRTPPWQSRRYITAATAEKRSADASNLPFTTATGKQISEYKKSRLEKELVYLKDPVKLADHTVGLLRQSDSPKALEIVRLGSKRMQCTVSWNHVIDYEMSKGRVNRAMKLYNEMKKRAQLPDARTYTTILRGLSWHPNYPQSVPRAITVYNSMYADSCPVKPNIIHTNAVLKVCALAKDLDALWGVAAKLPTHGPSAPDKLTFTTILNAIRTVAWDDSSKYNKEIDEDAEQKNAKRQQAVLQGRRMWDEIIGRWRDGDITIDEELVCSMGRLLLLGYNERDYDDVLSLLEQTMGIARQMSRLDTATSKSYPQSSNEALDPMLLEEDRASIGSDAALQASHQCSEIPPSASISDKDAELDDTPGGEFNLLPVSIRRNLPYPRPDSNTLSLSIGACIRLRATRAAQDYWGLLTSPTGPYKIVPDSENHHMYLRLLRLQRASRLAMELVKEMKEGATLGGKKNMVQAKTFRIAMSCCFRDANNKNAVQHAQALVRMMSETLEQPDVKTLEMYITVLCHRKDWRAMMAALRETEVGVANLRSLLAFGDKRDESRRDRKEIIAFARRLVRSYDLAMNLGRQEMQRAERQYAMEQRNRLTAWLIRQANKKIGARAREQTASDCRKLGSLQDAEAVDVENEEQAEADDHLVDLDTTKYTHLPRDRKPWGQYSCSRGQSDGQQFEREDSDILEPSSGASDADPAVLRRFSEREGRRWQRWSRAAEKACESL